MNKLFGFVLATIVFISCGKDNYVGPTAGLYGTFIDAQTNKPLEQDIILGTTIELREAGYSPVTPQFLIVKNDGTYANSLLFANSYNVNVVRGNFIGIPPQDIVIEGQTKLDFTVTPYISIKEASIVKSGTKVIATFKMEQNVPNTIRKIGLYAHSDSRVGEPMRLVTSERTFTTVSNPTTVYSLEIDLPSNSSILKPGFEYFFRVGAAINVPEARLNYAPAVKIAL